MSGANWVQYGAFFALIAISTPLLGNYMYRVYRGDKAPGDRVFVPVERAIDRICRIDPDGEQRWNIYALSLMVFSMAALLLTYLNLRLQAHLPLNPDHQKAVSPGLSFNTALSFTTNTD
jgi:K+-transporting ATPase ATPase A chain